MVSGRRNREKHLQLSPHRQRRILGSLFPTQHQTADAKPTEKNLGKPQMQKAGGNALSSLGIYFARGRQRGFPTLHGNAKNTLKSLMSRSQNVRRSQPYTFHSEGAETQRSGPSVRCWLGQAADSFDSPELVQTGSPSGAGASPGRWPQAARNRVHVRSCLSARGVWGVSTVPGGFDAKDSE